MKQKRQLKHLLVRSTYLWLRCALLILIFLAFCVKDGKDGRYQVVEEVSRFYVETFDEELLALLASISDHRSASIAAPGVEEHKFKLSQVRPY